MKIKYKLIMGIILIAFMLSVGIVYSQGSLYSDPQGRFSFNLPAGWKADVPDSSTQAAYFTYSDQQGIIGELMILILERESAHFSENIDQYVERMEENAFKPLTDYKSGTKLPATVSGLSAVKINFTFIRYQKVQAEVYMFLSGNYGCSIILMVSPDHFAQIEPGFAQAVASYKVQGGAPLPQPIPPPTPTPVPSGMTVYTDPQGRFSIPIPAGSTTVQTTEMGVVLNTPQSAAVLYTMGEQYVQGMVAQIKPDHQFHGQSQLQAGNRQALVEVYSKINPQDNVNYATVVVTYPGTPFMMIVAAPSDKYNQAQTWIIEMIKGVYIR